MKHGLLAALAPALMLGGCAFTSLEHGLGGLMGQDVDKAVARLGAPNAERKLDDGRELEWNTFSNRAVVLGNVGNGVFQTQQSIYAIPTTTGGLLSLPRPSMASTPPNRVVTRPQYCKVIVQVDSRDVIRQTRYDGDFDGCYAYGQLLGKKT